MRLATTRGTNALLERKGARTVLFITRGFADLLRIGTQQRPDLFALRIEKPEPLYDAVVEVPERLAADGSVLLALEDVALDQLSTEAARLLAAGFEAAAVAFLHSYRNPVHERVLGDLLRRAGFRHVALSASLAPLIKILPRAETAVVDAYLSKPIAGYLARVAAALPAGALHVMTSAGGLVRAAAFRAKDSLLSGPAGGVVGAAGAGRRSGFSRVIAFDMGGTSTDVARYDGDFEYLFEHRVGDAHLVAPALAVESVAAGGGSVCRYDGFQLKVGPESTGASPGPACYGAGGPLTLTDVNLLLGRLDPERFEIPIEPAAAERALRRLRETIADAEGDAPEAEALLEGLLDIADERMADAIRRISLARGYDPADYALVAFGGAGAQHACAVASRLGIRQVLVPEDAGLLSAAGLAAAVVERFEERQVLLPVSEVRERIGGWMEELGRTAAAAVEEEGVPAEGDRGAPAAPRPPLRGPGGNHRRRASRGNAGRGSLRGGLPDALRLHPGGAAGRAGRPPRHRLLPAERARRISGRHTGGHTGGDRRNPLRSPPCLLLRPLPGGPGLRARPPRPGRHFFRAGPGLRASQRDRGGGGVDGESGRRGGSPPHCTTRLHKCLTSRLISSTISRCLRVRGFDERTTRRF